MGAYYNEIEPFAAAWLRNLIAAGHIAPGDVDERSIVDVKPDDLIGYTQCHFFAGIGGWSLAARLAGWPDNRPLWTGSCPCQPFSAAGKRKGEADERHLWPVLAALVRERRPSVVAGEQVASNDGLRWLDGVCADLEAANYTVWSADFCAASVGAPHIRQRLWWLADSNSQRHDRQHPLLQRDQQGRVTQDSIEAPGGGIALGLADAERGGCQSRAIASARTGAIIPPQDCKLGGLGDASEQGLSARERAELSRTQRDEEGRAVGQSSGSFWSAADWLPCRDGKSRPVEPGTFPLAHGVPGRVGRLRAFGNAIVPQVAAQFLKAYIAEKG